MCCYRASIGLCTTHDTRHDTRHNLDTRPRRSLFLLIIAALSTLTIRSILIRVTLTQHKSFHSGYLSRFVVRRREAPGITYHTTMAPPAALPPLPFNPARVRSYILRIPLFTRLVLLATIAFWVLELQTLWSVVQWGSLAPDEIGLGSSMFSSCRFDNM